MRIGSIEAHGFAEAVPVEGGGRRLQRVPEALRTKLLEGAQWQFQRPAGGELRAVAEDNRLRLTLSAPAGDAQASVFFGNFESKAAWTLTAEPREITVQAPEHFWRLPEACRRGLPFSPRVIRVRCQGGPVVLHDAAGAGVRPPEPTERPPKKLLAYGTSITHGAAATTPHLSYVQQLAWRLGADALNLGVGGACMCEPELADWIAAREDWDAALLSLSVNMLPHHEPEAFAARVRVFVETVAAARPRRPVFCVTLYPHYFDWGFHPAQGHPAKGEPEAYRRALREVAAGCDPAQVHCYEGPELFDDLAGLTTDLIHPGDLGMIRLAENLAGRLRPVLARSDWPLPPWS
jgi:lysophospholipase L1-like esterase